MYRQQIADLKFGSGDFNLGLWNGHSDTVSDILTFSQSLSSSGAITASLHSGFTSAVTTDDFRDTVSDRSSPLGIAKIGGSVSGSIESHFDSDVFSVSLTAGQTYTIDLKAAGSGLDPALRLLGSNGSQIASNLDFGGSNDSRITFTAKSTGTYYIEARDEFFGRGNYTLTVGSSGPAPTPTPTATDDFRDSLIDATAPLGQLEVGSSLAGRIETAGDSDIFSVTLTAGQSYSFKLAGAATGGLSDPTFRLLGGNGTQLAVNNDFGGSKNSQIDFTATSSGTYYLEAKGATAALTGGYSVSAAQVIATPTPTTSASTGAFDIKINYTGDQQYAYLFEQAAARWEAVITADVPDIRTAQYGLIDDLLIDASISYIDGPGNGRTNTLAQAGPDLLRSGSLIPAHGVMQFDSYDLGTLAGGGDLLDVITHEMGHVLGLGTLWGTQQKGLVSNFQYTGANALAEYRTLTGNPNAAFVPVEQDGGPGTAGGHWDDELFGSEMMTGYISGGMELSRMTVGALADLGYSVNYAAADPYTLPRNMSSLVAADTLHDTATVFGVL